MSKWRTISVLLPRLFDTHWVYLMAVPRASTPLDLFLGLSYTPRTPWHYKIWSHQGAFPWPPCLQRFCLHFPPRLCTCHMEFVQHLQPEAGASFSRSYSRFQSPYFCSATVYALEPLTEKPLLWEWRPWRAGDTSYFSVFLQLEYGLDRGKCWINSTNVLYKHFFFLPSMFSLSSQLPFV